MSTIPPSQRVELSPAVRAILEADGSKSALLKLFVRYMDSLIAHDPAGLDATIAPDAHFHELDALGVPPGIEGVKTFRRVINAGIPDEHVAITAVSFEGDNFIEADLHMTATQTGELLGIPATGRKINFDVHERCRFVDGKLAERWAQVDIEGIKRQLTDPI